MALAELGEEVLDTIENSFFGNASYSAEDSTMDIFADDEFFHPLVIHDDETCKWILHHTLSHIDIKLWDLLLFIPGSVFLSVLLLGFQKTRQRIRGLNNSYNIGVLYVLVFVMVCTGVIRGLLNMFLNIEFPSSSSEKLLWTATRFVFLTSEVCYLAVGATIESVGKAGLRRILVISTSLAASLCCIQAYLEIYKPYYGNKVIRTGLDLYGHGGPEFWTVLSALLVLAYLVTLCLPMMPTKMVRMTSSRVYYLYIVGMLLLNLLTCLGALLLSVNNHNGMCLTDLTSYLYFSCLPVIAYFCFVRPNLHYSRPNLLFSYTTQVDDSLDDSALSCSASVQSFSRPEESSIIKQGALESTLFNASLQSPDTVEDRDLLIH